MLGFVIDQMMQYPAQTVFMSFATARELLGQMVPKGSVAVDGVSLTIVEVQGGRFSVALIPHTLERTTLGFKGPGAAVNLETDLIAKYVGKCLQVGGITVQSLRRAGFLGEPES